MVVTVKAESIPKMIALIFMIIAIFLYWTIIKGMEKTRKTDALIKYRNADPALRDDMINKIIRVGMSEEQVIDSWGAPIKRSSKILKSKTKATMYFGYSKYQSRVYLENGRVVGWHKPT